MTLVAILDDRATNRQIFSKLASSLEAGITVRAFGDPLSALDWLETNPPDLVVADYKMPNINGAEFTRRLRQRPYGVDVPLIMVTAYDDRDDKLRALDAGATDFLQTPVDHQEFLSRARNLLLLRRHQQLSKDRAQRLERALATSEDLRRDLLRSSRDALAQVIDTIPALISATDRSARYVFANARFAARAGSAPAELLGRSSATSADPDRSQRNQELDRLVFEGGQALPSFEETVLDTNGVAHVFLTTKAPLLDAAGQVVSVLTTSVDVSDRKATERHLLHMTRHDRLTDLPNQESLLDRIAAEVSGAPAALAVHTVALDRFKATNEAYGHTTGDDLLQQVGARLNQIVRPGDLVARLRGDEFAVLQTTDADEAGATAFAELILRALPEPFDIGGVELRVAASIGIALYPSHGLTGPELLRSAGVAMYRAKADGRNLTRLFRPDMNIRAQGAIALETDLRKALKADQFVLHYQPQFDVRSGRMVGVEALVRWRRPGWGLVSPAVFLPVAEATGLIVPIGAWVMREACTQAAIWRQSALHAGRTPLRMAVNLSPVQFVGQDLCQLVTGILDECGLPADLLDVELTESSLIADSRAAATTLGELKALGVRCSIDDFGIGYSSLAYVRAFPVDRLKIDRSFVRQLCAGGSDAEIVRAIINLGHRLNLIVIAEGVETREQLDQLRLEGCDEVQGYLLSKPVAAAEIEALPEQSPLLPTHR